MLKIITGRIATNKTYKIIEAIGQRISQKKKSILIVPDPVTYNFEQRLCSQLNINGFIDVEVCSFNRLASSVLDYFGKNKETYLDDCAKAMAVRACVLSCEDKLTIFKNASRRKGFSARCLNTISTFENCGYRPSDLFVVSEKLDSSILKYKLNDMAHIYQAYIDILERGYTDNANKLYAAQNLLPAYKELKNNVVYIDGFDVFTSHLYNFIGALIESTDVVIALSSCEDGKDKEAYEIHKKTLEKIISIAKEKNIAFKIEHASRALPFKSDEIHFLEDNFYAFDPDTFTKNCNNISLCYYPSPEEEVNSIAKKILTQVMQGNRFKNFAVLCNDIKKYSPIINIVFNRYNIPIYTDKKHDITAHPVAAYLFSLLKCVYLGFTPEHITDMALSDLTPLTSDERDAFISYIKEMGIKSWELENGLHLKRGSDESQIGFDSLRKKFIIPLKEFKADILKCSIAREMASVCYSFLEKQGVYKKIQELVDKYEALEFFELSDVTAQLWNKLQQLLEDISDLFGGTPVSVADFSETLFEGFKSTPVSTIPTVLDSVTFGDLTASKEQFVPYAFVIGANDGVIPSIATDDRIVTSAESAILAEYGLELAHSEETEDARIRYTIYSSLCSPTRQLELSCPIFSSTGNPLRPSYIFKRLELLFPNLKPTVYKNDLYKEELKLPLTREQAMFNMALDKFASPESQALLEFLEKSPDRKLNVLKNETKAKEINISPSLALSLFSPQNATSISRLETFAACPYKHFIEYGLTPMESKEYSADALDIGIVLHSTLELFTKENSKNNMSRTECYERTSAIFDSLLPDVHYGAMLSSERQKAFNILLKNIACEGAWAIKEHLKNFSVIGEEISFGTKDYPPIEIETEYGTLYIKGKIDRADKLEKDGKVYLRITDYKSGKKKFSAKNVENGTDLQLAIYMNALLSYFKNSVPASAQYMQITENVFSGPELDEFSEKGISSNDFHKILDTAKNTAQELSGKMLSGNIEATKTPSCAYCNFSSICGIKHIKEEETDA